MRGRGVGERWVNGGKVEDVGRERISLGPASLDEASAIHAQNRALISFRFNRPRQRTCPWRVC